MAGAEDKRRAFALGLRAETVAAFVLRLKGYRVIARRYTSPFGEIDLVARRGRQLVFVEVKARARTEALAEALAPLQRRRIERAAAAFVAQRADLAGLDHRFDAILIAPGRLPSHLPDAWRMGE